MDIATKTLKRTAGKSLTTASIAALKPGQVLSDGSIDTGAGRLKIRKRQTTTGSVAEWLFIYWGGDKGKRVTILVNGKASRYSPKEQEGFLTIAQAREVARRLQADVQSGKDPALQRQLERAENQKSQLADLTKLKSAKEKSLDALMAAYVQSLEDRGKIKSAYDVENLVKNHISIPFPVIAALPASEVTAMDVSRILARLVGPSVSLKKGRTALKLRSFMGAAFKLAMGAEIDPMAPTGASGFGLSTNPAASVPSTKMAAAFHNAGERVLTVDELRVYLTHLESVPSEIQRLALELDIMSGGQRLEQLLRLTQTELTPQTFTLFDPKGKRTKPRTHVLPLLPEISQHIERLKVLSPISETNPTGSLFANTKGAVMYAGTLSGVVRAISDEMVLAGESVTQFRGGDIRRTCETMMAETLGIHKDVRGQLLSHGLSGVQDKVYDKGQHLVAKTLALKSWVGLLKSVRAGTAITSNVVPLKIANM